MLDFIREPLIYFSAFLLVVTLFVTRKGRWPIVGMLAVTIAIHLWRIWPYTFIAPAEVPLPDTVDGASCATVLSFNVLQSNEEYDRTAALIDRVDPDILLLMETDTVWQTRLEPQLSRYRHRLDMPLGNTYGMLFASRVEVETAEFSNTFGEGTPTLYATMSMGDGARFELIGLHPRPPLPGESTAERDASIAAAGARTPDGVANALAIGDFNDVPWSETSEYFRKAGQYNDPRAGRGSFATFPADYAILGWPLDQIFVKGNVKVEELEIGEDVGSDHLPLVAKVCVAPASPN